MTDGLRAASPSAPGAVVVAFPGEIDLVNAPGLRARLGAALVPGITAIVADLTSTEYCDSTGMRMLVQAHREAARRGVELRLVLPDGAVLRIAQIMGLDTILPVYPTLALALPQPAPGG